MAPTEILSEQHLRKFAAWLAPLGVKIGWLHGGVPKKSASAMLEAPIVIGTHALIQEGVGFARLGLVVVDEQHRFGVEQRLALRRKAQDRRLPHQLMMSATPIPRTLSMTYYADLDVSMIDEMPPGRRPVTTRLFSDRARDEVLSAIRDACAEGQQAYWVCPVIEERRTATADRPRHLRDAAQGELKGLRVGLLHGRLPAAEKAAAMQASSDGQDPAAGLHHGDRGGRRRAERVADGDRERRALRPRAAAPAARARRARQRARASASCCTAAASGRARSA